MIDIMWVLVVCYCQAIYLNHFIDRFGIIKEHIKNVGKALINVFEALPDAYIVMYGFVDP